MKSLTNACLAGLFFMTSLPAHAHRTWIQIAPQISPYYWIDMQSIVVKGNLAYFNTGISAKTTDPNNPYLPKEPFILSEVANCKSRTIGTASANGEDGTYIHSPLDIKRRQKEGKDIDWDHYVLGNTRLEMVCPSNLLSDSFDQAF